MPSNNSDIESRLWAAADQLWANSNLRPSEFSTPVLGLIFLRYADHRFTEAEKEIGPIGSIKSGSRRAIGKGDYQARGVLYLPNEARFSNIRKLPEGSDLAQATIDAMKAIEAENEELKDILPKTYKRLDNATLIQLFRILSGIPMDIEGDAFGKIYEYFLGKFAIKEGQKGGEFFTPTSIVKLIVEIIEPYHGKIYDPASGSGGMFVQSAMFVEHHRKVAATEISIYGQEKVAETIRLAKMNLAVHGLSGDIRDGNTYYEDRHNSLGKYDFVMANPPFNVSGIDKEKIKDDPRFALGMPIADNANYLWIQAFYRALNENGRAGFVMHNSAADSEFEIRKKLIDANVVDVIITTSANLFYTVSLPCSLWFLDKSRKDKSRKDNILFIDARKFYREIDTVHREITGDQIAELASIVRSYRNEDGYEQYKDRHGICKQMTINEVRSKNYSLNPKIYVDAEDTTVSDSRLSKDISDDISIYQQGIDELKSALAKQLNISVPSDRGILYRIAKLLYKKWLVNLDVPNISYEGRAAGPVSLGWEIVPFRETVDFYSGGGWGNDTVDGQYSQNVRVIRGTDIGNISLGELNGCPLRYIKPTQLQSRILRDGDVIIEVSGGGKEQPTGRTTYITESLVGRSSEPLICASFCKLIRFNPTVLYPTIGFMHIQYLYDTKLIERYEVQSTGIKNFKFEYFLDNEKIANPPKHIQEQFHNVISNIFNLIHLLGAINEKTFYLTSVIPTNASQLGGFANIQIL